MSAGLRKLVSAGLSLAVMLCCALAVPRTRGSALEQPPTQRLPLGQSLALSDFDGDNLTDRASLGGAGLKKRIEIYLSSTGKISVLQFDTQSTEHGSLIADDVNNDGDVDLIWTDLLHPDEVVVWLNTGPGKFERVRSDDYASGFVLRGSGAGAPDPRFVVNVIGPVRAQSPDQEACAPSGRQSAGLALHQEPESSLTPSDSARVPSSRGPPTTSCTI
jgi:hypothetical protein